MIPAGFEPTIPGSERQQTDALDRAATGTGSGIFSEGNGLGHAADLRDPYRGEDEERLHSRCVIAGLLIY